MAMKIIIEYDDQKQVEISVELDEDKNWEEVCYQIGCKVAREVAMLWLKAMEEVLHQHKEKSLRVECRRSRIRVTRFGKFRIRRRLYIDSHGNYRFLLDEHLNWLPYKWSTSAGEAEAL